LTTGLSDEPSDAFDGCTTVWDLTARLCEELDARVGAVGCIVSRVIGDVLVQVAEHAPDGRSFQLGRGFLVSQFPTTAEVLSSGEARAVDLDDPDADQAEAAVLRDLAVRGVLMLALRDGPTAWGLIEVYRSEPSTFTPEEQQRAGEIVRAAEARLRTILDVRRRG
jgi:GAF domain-containing protein